MECTDKNIRFKYLPCEKKGFHDGEFVNIVCLEKNCIDNSICCCACIEAEHQKHHTKPIKMFINQAKEATSSIKPPEINFDVVLDIVNGNRKSAIDMFKKYKESINTNLDKIENKITLFYNESLQQIVSKNTDMKSFFQEAIQFVNQPQNYEDLRSSVKKIISMIPKDNEQIISQQILVQSLKMTSQTNNNSMEKVLEEIKKKMEEALKNVEESIKGLDLMTPNIFKFSETFKHNDVKILSNSVVKSCNNSGYKFILVEPGISSMTGSIKKFGFKVKDCTSNWIGIGMAHQKIVKSKNYAFNFGSIGHGAYMISANGGSWSNTQAQFNNTVKAFKFSKNDTIAIEANMETKKITFKKASNCFQAPYELSFQTINDDELYPCVLFYYLNDEVQFLPNFSV